MKFVAKLFGVFYYRDVLANWLGCVLGTVIALFAAPGVFVFPLIYWFVQGAFPTFYFELLGGGAITDIVEFMDTVEIETRQSPPCSESPRLSSADLRRGRSGPSTIR